jgi:hypothetical protein
MGLEEGYDPSRCVAPTLNAERGSQVHLAAKLQRARFLSQLLRNPSINLLLHVHQTTIEEVPAKAAVLLVMLLFHSLVGYIDTRLSRRKGMFHPSQYHVRPFSGFHVEEEMWRSLVIGYQASKKSALLLLASGAGEGVGDGLAGVAGHVLSLLHDTLALVRRVVAAGAGGVAELLAGGLLALWCGVLVDGSEKREVVREGGKGTYQAGRRRQGGHQLRRDPRWPSGWWTSGSRG